MHGDGRGAVAPSTIFPCGTQRLWQCCSSGGRFIWFCGASRSRWAGGGGAGFKKGGGFITKPMEKGGLQGLETGGKPAKMGPPLIRTHSKQSQGTAAGEVCRVEPSPLHKGSRDRAANPPQRAKQFSTTHNLPPRDPCVVRTILRCVRWGTSIPPPILRLGPALDLLGPGTLLEVGGSSGSGRLEPSRPLSIAMFASVPEVGRRRKMIVLHRN